MNALRRRYGRTDAELVARMKRRVRGLSNRVTIAEQYLTALTAKTSGGGPACEGTPATEKATRLISLAANPGASEAEARTSAFLAAKLIQKEQLKVCK